MIHDQPQSEFPPFSMRGDPDLQSVRQACAAAWRMRGVASINWGVRDWSKLRFQLHNDMASERWRILIFGALPESALGLYVWEKLGAKPRVTVECLP